MAKDAPGMKGYRPRDENGELRQKRSDTHIGSLEKEYSVDLGRRSDMKLGTLREELGVIDIKDILKCGRKA
jgi:hypothetical protein